MDVSTSATASLAQLIALLKTLAPFEHWHTPDLSEDVSRWVACADRQELMSMIVAGLWRLMSTPDPGATDDGPPPVPADHG